MMSASQEYAQAAGESLMKDAPVEKVLHYLDNNIEKQ